MVVFDAVEARVVAFDAVEARVVVFVEVMEVQQVHRIVVETASAPWSSSQTRFGPARRDKRSYAAGDKIFRYSVSWRVC